MIDFKGCHFENVIILMSVPWYLAYPPRYRQIEELLAERVVDVDHSTVNRWVVKYSRLFENEFTKNYKAPVCSRWRMDETYIKGKDIRHCLYRAVDKTGATIISCYQKDAIKKRPTSLLENL